MRVWPKKSLDRLCRILMYDHFDQLIEKLKQKEKPLALYLFSSNQNHIQRVCQELSYGGGCINDVVIHLATGGMGFGGVGESGMGSYHGKDGFDAFSHYKSIVDKKRGLICLCAISLSKINFTKNYSISF